MSSVRRGGGRPNRGGGSANRSRGRGFKAGPPPPAPSGPSGNLSRKTNMVDDDDMNDYEDDDYLDYDEDEYEDESANFSSTAKDQHQQGNSNNGNKDGEANKKPPQRRKVEIQVLHMSQEAQDLVHKTLTELRGGSFKINEKNLYKDTGQNLDRRFWVRDRTLLVRGVEKQNAAASDAGGVTSSELPAGVSAFAMKKLSSLGFHPTRCIKALKEADGDVGQALEFLMSDAFDLGLRLNNEANADSSDDDKEMLAAAVEDEKMALESIYGDAFSERIANKSWEMKFFLPHLLKYLPPETGPAALRAQAEKVDKKICQFYSNGYCKFGFRCRLKHVQSEKVQVVDDRHLRTKPEEMYFILEIRFPEGLSYPKDPPIVYFSTPMKPFPSSTCLKITYRLMQEAKLLAQDCLPSIFALVSLLENQSEMDLVAKGPDVPFSFDEAFLPSSTKSSVDKNKSSSNLDGIGSSLDNGEAVKSEDRKSGSDRPKKSEFKIREENEKIRKRFFQKVDQAEYRKMLDQRQQLPAWNERQTIIEAVESAQVVVISGMTGCGKSTQVPQYIIDHWLESKNAKNCNIICTQPRRISAIGVAERVASERVERIGNVVGYQIRLESKMSSSTRLLFCTTGILLRRLESDPDLSDVTHVIVDEVHERSEESDFLLMILRDLIRRKKDLRILLMSATLNASLFAGYFGSVPVIDIPGRTFPVDQIFLEEIIEMAGYCVEPRSQFAKREKGSNHLDRERFKGNNRDAFIDSHDYEMLLQDNDEGGVRPAKDNKPDEELNSKQIFLRYSNWSEKVRRTLSMMDFEKIDYDLIEKTLLHIVERYPSEGSILVFLPGMQEIMTAFDQIANHPLLGVKAGKFKLVPLHSSLSSEQQAAVFEKPRQGVRKIVLSTNLAETSITIDDCVFVVEVGRMKEKRFDPLKSMESLDTVWVSRANALQRKGRAGRVRPGFCFHLYTEFRYAKHFREDPIPEIQRVPLEQMLLRIKILPLFSGANLYEVLSKMIEPPSKDAIDSAVKRLKDVGALYQEESNLELTPLGFHLSRLPVDVRIGKLMLFGAIFKCLDSALTIAACLSYRSPFNSPFDKRNEAKKKKMEFSARHSDHLTVLRAYMAWQEACLKSQYAGYAFSQENFLSQKTLQTLAIMKHQFLELLSSIGFVPEGVSCRQLDRLARNGNGDAVARATGPDLNCNNVNYKLMAAVLCAALYPNIVQVLTPELKYKQTSTGAMCKAPTSEELKFKTKDDGYVFLHPSSVTFNTGHFENPYLVYHEKIKTSRVFLREVSMVPVYPMVLFGGTGVDVSLQRGKYVLSMEGGWIKFVCATFNVAEYLKEIRLELDRLMEEKIAEPTLDLITYPRGKLIIDTIVKLLSTE